MQYRFIVQHIGPYDLNTKTDTYITDDIVVGEDDYYANIDSLVASKDSHFVVLSRPSGELVLPKHSITRVDIEFVPENEA